MAKTTGDKPTQNAPSAHTSQNTPRHKLIAMGQSPKVSTGGAKTPA